ncbi:hypothetical protein D3C76_1442500 [compost metagenome]
MYFPGRSGCDTRVVTALIAPFPIMCPICRVQGLYRARRVAFRRFDVCLDLLLGITKHVPDPLAPCDALIHRCTPLFLRQLPGRVVRDLSACLHTLGSHTRITLPLTEKVVERPIRGITTTRRKARKRNRLPIEVEIVFLLLAPPCPWKQSRCPERARV